jgi:hypothetical protein
MKRRKATMARAIDRSGQRIFQIAGQFQRRTGPLRHASLRLDR